MVSFDVAGKAVLVVGGSQGIGLEISRAFAEAGGDVTIVAEVPEVEAVARDLGQQTGREIGALRCDISDQSAVEAALGSLDHLDVLINNAGISPPAGTPIEDPSTNDTFARVLDVNVKGLFWVTQAALPLLGPGGRIVFTASIWAKSAAANYGAYVASKHAVLGLVRTLAHELGPRGITVNAVCPGTTNTPTAATWSQETLDEIAATMVIHNEKILEPEHLAGTYVFLASPAASEITGQAINVDRGQVMA